MENLNLIQTWAETHMETILFYALAVVVIPCAFGVILDRAVIRSGFILIGVFGTICGLFFLLEAQFIALAQLMIYAVGITLVVVIALMLTNPQAETRSTPSLSNQKLGAFLVAFLMFVTIYESLRSETFPVSIVSPKAADNIQVLGQALTTTYALPFEFASVLLLAALIGAIMLAKAESTSSVDQAKNEVAK